MNKLIKKADVLIEALPYIRTFKGKTVVIKYGGHAMTDASLKARFAQNVVLLKYVGLNPVVVHRGGPQIDQMLDRLGMEAKFKHGIELNSLLETITSGKVTTANQPYKFLPEYINKRIEDLYKITQERDKLSLAYNENTFAFKQKEQELKALKDQVFSQLTEIKKEWLTSLAELGRRKDIRKRVCGNA